MQAIVSDADLRGANVTGIDWTGINLCRTRLDSAQAIVLARSYGAIIDS
jgi:uncharacterized protein YjbI with pentapeptide repeats